MDAKVSSMQTVEAQSPRKSSAKRYLLMAAAALALIGGDYYGLNWYVAGRFIQSTDNAYLRADKVSMAPVVSGKITELYVADNQTVTVGQPLVKIDPRRYEMAVSAAKATITSREADVTKSEADLTHQDLVIAQAKADLDNAVENVQLAQQDVDRTLPLATRGVETQQKVDQVKSAIRQAESVVRLKQAVLDAARQEVTALKALADHSHAELAAARQDLGKAELDLNDTVLRSAIDGRVGDRTVQVGQFVQPGTQLLTVVPTDDVYLVANYKETQIGDIRQGQTATIHVDAFPDLKLTGTVESFAPGTGSQFALLPPENATGNFTKIVQRVPVRIKVNTTQGHMPILVPGLSIEVSVDTRQTSVDKMASAQ